MKKVTPVIRLELIDRVVIGGEFGAKAAQALKEGLKLKSLEELLAVVCVQTPLTTTIFDACADATSDMREST